MTLFTRSQLVAGVLIGVTTLTIGIALAVGLPGYLSILSTVFTVPGGIATGAFGRELIKHVSRNR